METSLFYTKIGPLGSIRWPLPSQCNKIQRTLCWQLNSTGCTPNPSYFLFLPYVSLEYEIFWTLCCHSIISLLNYQIFKSYDYTINDWWHCWKQIDGTIVAPEEPKSWDPKNPRGWLVFSNLTAVSFQGEGVIDGSGSKWWEASCKRNKSNVSVKHTNNCVLTGENNPLSHSH